MHKNFNTSLYIILLCFAFWPLFSCLGQVTEQPHSQEQNTQPPPPPPPDNPPRDENPPPSPTKEQAEPKAQNRDRPLPTPPGTTKGGAMPAPPTKEQPGPKAQNRDRPLPTPGTTKGGATPAPPTKEQPGRDQPLPTAPGTMKRGKVPPPPPGTPGSGARKEASAPAPPTPTAGKPPEAGGGVSQEALRSASEKLKKAPERAARRGYELTEDDINQLEQEYKFRQDWRDIAARLEKDFSIAMIKLDEREQEVLKARQKYVYDKIKKEEEAEAAEWEP